MSTPTKRPRCAVCRKPLPGPSTRDKCAGACQAQTVLFPKRVALRLVRKNGSDR
jgi:hypothetical protein